MALSPYRQGDLDALCGVYSVINAVALAAEPHTKLTRRECRDLFAFLVCALKLDDKLLAVLVSGGHASTVSRLLKVARCWLIQRHGLALSYRRPFHRKSARTMTEARQTLRDHVRQPHCAAIIRITGRNDHWTVVSGVSDRTGVLRLFDSGDLQYLTSRQPPIRTRPPTAAPVLYDTFFIRIEAIAP